MGLNVRKQGIVYFPQSAREDAEEGRCEGHQNGGPVTTCSQGRHRYEVSGVVRTLDSMDLQRDHIGLELLAGK